MSDDDDGDFSTQLRDRAHHLAFALGVERARRLVEDEKARSAKERARDRDPLPLSTRKRAAPLADLSVETARARIDQVLRSRISKRILELVIARAGASPQEILAQRAGEKIWLLRRIRGRATPSGAKRGVESPGVDEHRSA